MEVITEKTLYRTQPDRENEVETVGPLWFRHAHLLQDETSKNSVKVMLRIVKSDRTHGRLARTWTDDITDWCDCTLLTAD